MRGKISLYKFILQVIETLLPQKETPKLNPIPRHSLKHIIGISEERNAEIQTKRKTRRKYYKANKKVTYTTFVCNNCNDIPGLCLGICFENLTKANKQK